MKFLGEIYKEKILVLPKESLHKIELEYHPENLRIEKDFFGWKLCYTTPGKRSENIIECHSEEEARYLKIFFEFGILEIYVPKNDELLKNLLPELEKLKKRVDEVLSGYMETILNRKIREQLKHEVYMEIVK